MEQPNATLSEKLKHDVQSATQGATERSRSLIDSEKKRLVNGLYGIANVLDQSAQQLRKNNDPNMASYIEMACDKLEQASHYLESASTKDIVRDVSSVTRRNPVMAFGGLFLAGIGLARVLKSVSSERPQSDVSVVPQHTSTDDSGVIRHFQAS